MKNLDMASPKITRDRPPIFRALGLHEPPAIVQIHSSSNFDGVYQRVQIFKHDSWAATALYASGDREIVCKFNRQQRIGLIPMGWLGNFLARRETFLLQKLSHVANIPNSVGPILVDGQSLENATAHVYVPGRPFKHDYNATDTFLVELEQLIGQVHAADVAFVDLHKSENILVGDDGKPYLIDFQIGFWKPSSKVAAFFCNWLLLALQRSDRYHLLKHITKCRPTMDWNQMHLQRPWYIRLHRRITIPLRTLASAFFSLKGDSDGRRACFDGIESGNWPSNTSQLTSRFITPGLKLRGKHDFWLCYFCSSKIVLPQVGFLGRVRLLPNRGVPSSAGASFSH